MLQRKNDERRDGRRVRGEENRRKIIAALLKLVESGVVSPSAEQVAGEAGVGLRTVFRHFADMDSLYAEMSERMRAIVQPIVERPFAGSSWRDNLQELIDRRAQVFERVLPFKVAGDARRHGSPYLIAEQKALVAEQRAALRRVVPKNIDKTRFDALDLTLCFDSWGRLRNDQGLSPREARAAVRLAVEAITSSLDP